MMGPRSPDSLRRAQQIEDRVWVELIKLEAPLDPEPISKGDATTERKRGNEGNGVGRREEEEIGD